MKDTKGMSVVLRVIVTGVVLIMIAMTVVFIGTGGLQRVAGPEGEMEQTSNLEIAKQRCRSMLDNICRNRDNYILAGTGNLKICPNADADRSDCGSKLGDFDVTVDEQTYQCQDALALSGEDVYYDCTARTFKAP